MTGHVSLHRASLENDNAAIIIDSLYKGREIEKKTSAKTMAG